MFDNLAKFDLIEFRNHLEQNTYPENPIDRQTFYNLKALLKFIDDFLNLNILNNVGLQTL
jgi:hypothetical protein